MKRVVVISALIILILLTGSALAMESDNYKLDWFTPLTSSGGGVVSSANYAINFTVGQAVIGTADSTSYVGCLGYWCSTAVEYRVYLPLILRNAN